MLTHTIFNARLRRLHADAQLFALTAIPFCMTKSPFPHPHAATAAQQSEALGPCRGGNAASKVSPLTGLGKCRALRALERAGSFAPLMLTHTIFNARLRRLHADAQLFALTAIPFCMTKSPFPHPHAATAAQQSEALGPCRGGNAADTFEELQRRHLPSPARGDTFEHSKSATLFLVFFFPQGPADTPNHSLQHC